MEVLLHLKYLGSRMSVADYMVVRSALILGVVRLVLDVARLVLGVVRLVLSVVRLVNENNLQPAPGSRDCTSRMTVDSLRLASVDLADIFFIGHIA